jgi:hypothetical protein
VVFIHNGILCIHEEKLWPLNEGREYPMEEKKQKWMFINSLGKK